MIAADTSSMVAFLQGESGRDVDAVEEAVDEQSLVVAPVVITELLSDFRLPEEITAVIAALPVLPITEGYWERAGVLRALLRRKRVKAKVGDCLIAQSCLDYQVSIITRDNDFRHFEKYASLSCLWRR